MYTTKSKILNFQELKANWKSDLVSGFLVSLIALPLCLGIAGASDFPPIMGVITAIVGGLLVSIFAGSELTIKGPAAGLIVIVAGCVHDFGGDEKGWHLALGVVVAAGIVQVILGKFKVAKFADIFPISSVHGLLAAIGIIIISRQVHLLLGEDPSTLKNKSPIDLLAMIPHSLTVFNSSILIIGTTSLVILFIFPFIKVNWVKRIPAALIVLVVSVFMAKYFHLNDPEFASLKPLIKIGSVELNFNVDFSGIWTHSIVFFEYLLMFVLIGSLEALLSNKAIDLMDPLRRKANNNRDMMAIGAGNVVTGIFGGLPMISEIARSSSNVMNGGLTKWSNFFHGAFLLIYVAALTPLISMVPVAALSAMLIYVGLRLASAHEFRRAWALGKDQFLIFFATMIMCLVTDLLLGVFTGVALELIIHLYRGMNLKEAFKATLYVQHDDDEVRISAGSALVFTNLMGLKKQLSQLPKEKKIVIDVSNARVIDHTAFEALHNLEEDYKRRGVEMQIVGLESHHRSSDHHLSSAFKK
jgi:MFS superfamily sulfate permease-like transporter